jgi:beta-glucanase (GH16 family)
MRVRRVGALAVVLAMLGTLSACTTSSAPSEKSTVTAATPPTVTSATDTANTVDLTAKKPADNPDGPKGHWKLVFSDHFAGTALNTSKWSTCYFWGCTNNGNNELQYYEASQVKVHDGTLTLTVIPKRTHGKQYASGLLSSHGKFSFRYGYAQIVAKLPRGRGVWPSFWTVPENGTWPPEIDIMENWEHQEIVNFYVHYNAGPKPDHAVVLLPDACTTFNTYGVDWEPGSISWYVDGVLWAHFKVSITEPEYLIVNLAVFGLIPPNASDRFPQSLAVRSIQVWQHPPRTGS